MRLPTCTVLVNYKICTCHTILLYMDMQTHLQVFRYSHYTNEETLHVVHRPPLQFLIKCRPSSSACAYSQGAYEFPLPTVTAHSTSHSFVHDHSFYSTTYWDLYGMPYCLTVVILRPEMTQLPDHSASLCWKEATGGSLQHCSLSSWYLPWRNTHSSLLAGNRACYWSL